MAEIFGGKELDELRDDLTLTWMAQAEKNKMAGNSDNNQVNQPDCDYDFIKLELDDGNIEIPQFKTVDIMNTEKPDKNGKIEKGYIMVFDCLDTPFEAYYNLRHDRGASFKTGERSKPAVAVTGAIIYY